MPIVILPRRIGRASIQNVLFGSSGRFLGLSHSELEPNRKLSSLPVPPIPARPGRPPIPVEHTDRFVSQDILMGRGQASSRRCHSIAIRWQTIRFRFAEAGIPTPKLMRCPPGDMDPEKRCTFPGQRTCAQQLVFKM